MADYRYAYNGPQEGTAKAVLKDAPISTKAAIEISNHLRGRKTSTAKAILERVLKKEEAIPYKRFTDGVGHRPGKGMAAGRYPYKAARSFLDLLNSVEANAAQAGLSDQLIIKHLASHEGSRSFSYGRHRRRRVKQTHVEIAVKEDEKAKRAEKKQAKKQPSKTGEKEAPKQDAQATTPQAPKKDTASQATQESKTTEKKQAAPQEKTQQQDAGKKADTSKHDKPAGQEAPKKDNQSQQKKESAQQ